jgi:hypothetical protein
VDLRAEAKSRVDEYLAGGDIGALLRWITANRREVYATRDADTQELVDKARQTIDGVLKGHVAPENARAHLQGLLTRNRPGDGDWTGGPSRRLS